MCVCVLGNDCSEYVLIVNVYDWFWLLLVDVVSCIYTCITHWPSDCQLNRLYTTHNSTNRPSSSGLQQPIALNWVMTTKLRHNPQSRIRSCCFIGSCTELELGNIVLFCSVLLDTGCALNFTHTTRQLQHMITCTLCLKNKRANLFFALCKSNMRRFQ